MARHKDYNWNVGAGNNNPGGEVTYSYDQIQTSILMDLRDELKLIRQRLNVLQCDNFLRIPQLLQNIELNTRKRKRKK